MTGFNVATYTLQVFGPEEKDSSEWSRLTASDKRVLANLPAMLEAVEEDLTSLLPEGYRAIIKEWDGQL